MRVRSNAAGEAPFWRRPAVLIWLACMVFCAFAVARAQFTADLSAFLPSSPSAEQKQLVEQLNDGMMSRLILVGIEGGDSASRARVSRDLARRLRGDQSFASVNNGEPVNQDHDQRFVFDHRYLLSPAVTAQNFTVAGLTTSIGNSLALLSSSTGMLTKNLLPQDPTGEVTSLLAPWLEAQGAPNQVDGVWASPDGQRAVLLLQTEATGSNTDAAAHAIAVLDQDFTIARAAAPNAGSLRLLRTGPGVFAVQARDSIKSDVTRLSIVSLLLIVTLLMLVYRSPKTLLLGLLPVASGILAGIAAVSLGFGHVHGLTLGFGTTLIGEAVDYSIYLFMQAAHVEVGVDADPYAGTDADPYADPYAGTYAGSRRPTLELWIARFWPTVRLGVLTSLCGFASMLFSGFPGLVQLGLYSIAGLTSAALVTRFVLPTWLGTTLQVRSLDRLGRWTVSATRHAGRLRWPVGVLLIAACGVLVQRQSLWSHQLAALSPIPLAAQDLDASLRADAGAPDARYLLVVTAASQQAALQGAETVGGRLQPLVAQGRLGGFETPARFLPSQAAQRARQAALPPPDEMRARLLQALAAQTIKIKPDRLAPFLQAVSAARTAPPVTRADLQGTSMAFLVDTLLTRHLDSQGEHWSALLPLRAGAHGDLDIKPIRNALAPLLTNSTDVAGDRPPPIAQATAEPLPPGDTLDLIDLKGEADSMYAGYLDDDLKLTAAGLLAIMVLLRLALGNWVAVLRTLAPLGASVLVVAAGLSLAGFQLNLLHLVGMLLIVAIGSNYALFFNYRNPAHAILPSTLVSLVIANLSTVAGFGVLGFAHVPLLQTFGLTVGPGAILALLFSAVFAPRPNSGKHP
jgi:predicted exporter